MSVLSPLILELEAIRERMAGLSRNEIKPAGIHRVRLAFDHVTQAHALLMVASMESTHEGP